jgi:hypothetical protein
VVTHVCSTERGVDVLVEVLVDVDMLVVEGEEQGRRGSVHGNWQDVEIRESMCVERIMIWGLDISLGGMEMGEGREGKEGKGMYFVWYYISLFCRADATSVSDFCI